MPNENLITKQIKTVTIHSVYSAYSSSLRGLGDDQALNGALLAIVGGYAANKQACRIAYQMAQQAVRQGIGVISGLSDNIDKTVHEGALAAHGRTVAVLPYGLATPILPKDRKTLAEKIVQRGGLLVSETADEQASDGGMAYVRQAFLIARLCQAVIVVAAESAASSLHTARYAALNGQPVYVFPDEQAGSQALLAGDWLAGGRAFSELPEQPAQPMVDHESLDRLLAQLKTWTIK